MPSRRGRPHEGAELVEKLDDCSEQARSRLKVIFQTLAGDVTVEHACQALGIRRSAFNKLRSGFIGFDQINEGFDRLADGSVLRQILQPHA